MVLTDMLHTSWKKIVRMSEKNLKFATKKFLKPLSIKAHSEQPVISFEYGNDGQMAVAVRGAEVEYQGVFDKEKVVAAVRRLGLRLKDRASLYLDAADRCQDDAAAEQLLQLARECAGRAGRIDEVRQQFDIPLTPIGDANICVNGPFAKGRNRGVPAVPPTTVETFVPRLPIAITKEMREQMVRALEGTFVNYHRGEVALRAMGLVAGEMSCYVDWQAGLVQLAATTLFLLGRATFVLDDELVVNGCCLPAGSYGNWVPIVAARGGGERHWQMVATLFRDAGGGLLNRASLRSVAARVNAANGKDYGRMLYLFRPLIFDSNDRPRQNGLFRAKDVGQMGLAGAV